MGGTTPSRLCRWCSREGPGTAGRNSCRGSWRDNDVAEREAEVAEEAGVLWFIVRMPRGGGAYDHRRRVGN
jgi:hypothetical protein